MTDRALMLRAGTRVLLRVVAKAFAYLAVFSGLWWLNDALGEPPVWLRLVAVVPWAALALVVFAAKTREEAQRLRRHPS